MAAHMGSPLSAIGARVKQIWSEVNYANRRMFAIRTGEHFVEGRRARASRPARRTARGGLRPLTHRSRS